ncbi:MAG TPA: bifunctional tetrahydrofolate synthase/dihydrofolate synthase [Pseudomonadales bacterium]|nr:bifunctional tetrahydrofolate synthase/dihydrofolate synthase [Pseudomonadales bacterium]
MRERLSDWLHYLEALHPKTIELGLDRIKRVADAMHVRHFSCPVVTVAGTNGKGSNVAMLQAAAVASGYRVGAYTSPHLVHYNERICINGMPVSDAQLVQAFERVEAARGDTSLTYFEFGTLAALDIFQQSQLDLVILEIGLGGRLDAVNIVDADISIIASLGLDHTDWLGNTLEEIGYEKAGVIRPAKACVLGFSEIPLSVQRVIKEKNAHAYIKGQHFELMQDGVQWHWRGVGKDGNLIEYNNLPLPRISIQNAATAMQALALLPLPFSELALRDALQDVYVRGRFQFIDGQPTTLLDVAHNPAAGAFLAEQLQAVVWHNKIHAVVGMLGDKDWVNTLLPILPYIDRWYVTGLNTVAPRGETAQPLAEFLLNAGARVAGQFVTPTSAYKAACKLVDEDDLVLVFGSFFTVGEVLGWLEGVKRG